MRAQVMSVSQSRSCAVVDAGTKAVSLDSGPPQLLEAPNVAAGLLAPPGSGGGAAGALPSMSFEGVEFQNGGDEHGKLLWPLVSCCVVSVALPRMAGTSGGACKRRGSCSCCLTHWRNRRPAPAAGAAAVAAAAAAAGYEAAAAARPL